MSLSERTYCLDSRVRVSTVKSRRKKTKNSSGVVSKMRLDGADEDLQGLLDDDLDQAPARRSVREAFKEIQLGIDHCLLRVFLTSLIV